MNTYHPTDFFFHLTHFNTKHFKYFFPNPQYNRDDPAPSPGRDQGPSAAVPGVVGREHVPPDVALRGPEGPLHRSHRRDTAADHLHHLATWDLLLPV